MPDLKELNDFELANIAFLTRFGLDFGLLEPTATGLNKSIMDATFEYRSFLKRQSIHRYESQAQGVDGKRTIPSRILTADGNLIEAEASLYRPRTKKGDPRVWFSQLKRYCFPGDILVSLWKDGHIWLLNASRVDFAIAVESYEPFQRLLRPAISDRTSVFEELLDSLRALSSRGFIPILRQGDTAVGHLLETELGIKANSSKSPDYKGVEIKSTRGKKPRNLTLFAKVPDWKISQLKSVTAFWEEFGYDRHDGKGRRLNCTVSGVTWNSQGLQLRVDENAGLLHEISTRPLVPQPLSWPLGDLQTALAEKHADTFWVKAESRFEGSMEFIHYHSVVQTSRPIIQQLATLLASGGITVDHLINLKSSGNRKTPREAGPLFRLAERSFSELFPRPIHHDLSK